MALDAYALAVLGNDGVTRQFSGNLDTPPADGKNATVPSDALIQPPQAFVDAATALVTTLTDDVAVDPDNGGFVNRRPVTDTPFDNLAVFAWMPGANFTTELNAGVDFAYGTVGGDGVAYFASQADRKGVNNVYLSRNPPLPFSLNFTGTSSLNFLSFADCTTLVALSVNEFSPSYQSIGLQGASMSATALNAFFNSLPVTTSFKAYIYIYGTLGEMLCDPTIAIFKGWSVFGGPAVNSTERSPYQDPTVFALMPGAVFAGNEFSAYGPGGSNLQVYYDQRGNGAGVAYLNASDRVNLTGLAVDNNPASPFSMRFAGNENLVNVGCSGPLTDMSIDAVGSSYQGFYLSDCNMDAPALDFFFSQLPRATGFKSLIYVSRNPGSLTCDLSIATNKGYTVFN